MTPFSFSLKSAVNMPEVSSSEIVFLTGHVDKTKFTVTDVTHCMRKTAALESLCNEHIWYCDPCSFSFFINVPFSA